VGKNVKEGNHHPHGEVRAMSWTVERDDREKIPNGARKCIGRDMLRTGECTRRGNEADPIEPGIELKDRRRGGELDVIRLTVAVCACDERTFVRAQIERTEWE